MDSAVGIDPLIDFPVSAEAEGCQQQADVTGFAQSRESKEFGDVWVSVHGQLVQKIHQ